MKENRFVVLGAGGVGKTSLVVKFLKGTFSNTYKPTVEDCYQHTIRLPDGISHTVEILDTAGSLHFPAMRELSIRSCRGFLLVFSVDSLQSFREAVQLWELINKMRGPQIPIILVGNKTDLVSHRQVSHQMAAQTAQESMNGCRFLEASAKYDVNVNEVFHELLQLARDLEEAQEAKIEEEQELFRRKSRASKKFLAGRLSCLGTTAAAKNNPTESPSKRSSSKEDNGRRTDDSQRCTVV